jgi:hypothetical protein
MALASTSGDNDHRLRRRTRTPESLEEIRLRVFGAVRLR